MRSRTSLSHAKGSTSLSFAVAMREQTVAHRTPPPSEPANRWFLRPSATGRMARSTRPERSDQGAPDQLAKIAHRERVSGDSRRPVSRFGFAVGTGEDRALAAWYFRYRQERRLRSKEISVQFQVSCISRDECSAEEWQARG